jgi:hypothetical protein
VLVCIWRCQSGWQLTGTEKDVVEPDELGKGLIVESVDAVMDGPESLVPDHGQALNAIELFASAVVDHADLIADAAKAEFGLEPK